MWLRCFIAPMRSKDHRCFRLKSPIQINYAMHASSRMHIQMVCMLCERSPVTKCTVGCQTDPLVMNGCRDLPEGEKLFERCPVCCQTCSIEKTRKGALITIMKTCPHCKHSYEWNSQPHFGKYAASNLHLSAETAFTGSSFVQIQKELIYAAMPINGALANTSPPASPLACSGTVVDGENSLNSSGHGLYKVSQAFHRVAGPCSLQCFP
ncbi:uncharacterized protein ACWYII_009964 isoform 1-T1 [Salvelinus alpinus]